MNEGAILTTPHKFLANPIHWGLTGQATLFYGACWTDYGPLDLFLGRERYAESLNAIYVDNAIPLNELERFIRDLALRYGTSDSAIDRFELKPLDLGFRENDFFPSRASRIYPGGYADYFSRDARDFFGYRFYFKDLGLKLTYLKTEAIQTFKVLQSKLKIYPDLVVLHDHNWINLQFSGDSLMYRSAKVKPKFIYVASNGSPWPGYSQVAEPYVDEGQQHPVERLLYMRDDA